jgi:hypothetical protein
VCHWPLSYGVFEAAGVDVVLEMVISVESVNVGVFEVDDDVAVLEIVGIEYELLLADVRTVVFAGGIMELEGIGVLALIGVELAEEDIVLEEGLTELAKGVEGVALLEGDSAAGAVDEGRFVLVIVTGSETSTVTVGELTSMTEYPVAVTVAGLGVTVTSTVLVVSGPSTVFVDIMISVVGGRVSVSITVFVVGAWVDTIVSIIVAAAGEESSAEVAAAAPPSTGTTE